MPKVWNLGNTTVRNPNRIELGLKLFAEEFQGNIHGPDAEGRFTKRLGELKIIESAGENSTWFGRKWRSVFVKLGFSTGLKYRVAAGTFSPRDLADKRPELRLKGIDYELTPIGKRLLDAKSIGAINDVFLRQLLCHEIPSPIEGSFPEGRLKPFVFLLQILHEVGKNEEKGLNIFEIAAFLQLFVDHKPEQVKKTTQNILEYRKQREKLQGRVEKRKFDFSIIENAAAKGNVRSDTLGDYADTTFRYSQMTGLLSLRGSRLVFRENKIPIIEEICSEEPIFRTEIDSFSYLAEFYSGIELPTDNAMFSKSEIRRLSDQIYKSGETPLVDSKKIEKSSDIQEIEIARYTLLEQYGWMKEEQFADEQKQEQSIYDTLDYLEAIENTQKCRQKGIYDRPSYFEWAVWRGFLAIDHIVIPTNKTRRFPLDEDLLPRHPAPGGGPDMIFEFEDFILVVEVTLTSSSRQEAAEGEPVRRHVADVKKETSKDVYGIFVAPTIDNNTAETFRVGTWYRGDKEDFVNIVPFPLDKFREILAFFVKKSFTPIELRDCLDRCLLYRNTRAPKWKAKIRREIDLWLSQLRA